MKMTSLVIIVGLLIFSSFAFASEDKKIVDSPERIVSVQAEYFPPSSWGHQPVKVTKELVCRQHPNLCEKKTEEKTE